MYIYILGSLKSTACRELTRMLSAQNGKSITYISEEQVTVANVGNALHIASQDTKARATMFAKRPLAMVLNHEADNKEDVDVITKIRGKGQTMVTSIGCESLAAMWMQPEFKPLVSFFSSDMTSEGVMFDDNARLLV